MLQRVAADGRRNRVDLVVGKLETLRDDVENHRRPEGTPLADRAAARPQPERDEDQRQPLQQQIRTQVLRPARSVTRHHAMLSTAHAL